MAGDMVTLCAGCATILPPAGEAEIVGALAANVVIAEMVVEGLWVEKGVCAVIPETSVCRGRRGGGTSGGGRGRGRESRRSHVVEGQGVVHHVLKGDFCLQAKTLLAAKPPPSPPRCGTDGRQDSMSWHLHTTTYSQFPRHHSHAAP